MASKFDVLQSKTNLSLQMPPLVKAENNVEVINAQFKKLLVIDIRDPIMVDGALKIKDIEVKETDFLSEAYRRNPQMILKVLGVDLSKWAIEFEKAGWLPKVDAGMSYMYKTDNLNNFVNPEHNLWSVGMRASMPLFDGFATKAKVDEARAKYGQARFEKSDYADQLAVDMRTACLDVRKAKALIDAQSDSVIDAKEALRLSEVRFRNGVGINLDVFDAEVSLAQVETSLAQAIYDYIMAKAQIDKLRGREYAGDLWQ
jgi:outer membrane protein TolC